MNKHDNKSFFISKAQMEILTHLRNGAAVKISINSNALKLEFVTIPMDLQVNQNILLALIKKELILIDEAQNVILTRMGMRMANLGLQPERIGKAIIASAPTSSDIKKALHTDINGEEIYQDAKKRAKRAYKSIVRKSYTLKPK